MKCGYEVANTCLYSVQTYIDIYACVCTMYRQRYECMNMYVHLHIFMYMYIPCTYMFMSVCQCMNIYVHVCTMFRHVCTVLPILVQVVRIPDVLGRQIPDGCKHSQFNQNYHQSGYKLGFTLLQGNFAVKTISIYFSDKIF